MRLIAIVGPTAVGKSALAIAIAKRLNAEIISGDAFQFYQGLTIGTAKTTVDTQEGILHHLIDILPPDATFSVADYQRLVRSKIEELMAHSITPVLVGGSGLYVQSVLYNYQFMGEKREDDEELSKLSNGELMQLLATLDEDAAKECDGQNRRRLLRSIEIAASGKKRTTNDKSLWFPDTYIIGLTMERAVLYEAINQRVETMFDNGLIDEVKALYDKGIHSQAIAAIGYKELYAYFDGKMSLDEAKDAIKQASRRLAKRQLTWFKNQMNAMWYTVDPDNFEQTIIDVLRDIQ